MPKMDEKRSVKDYITISGAREHNLKKIDVAIPKGKLTVITGPSGSGKSTLAIDILFTEGKRRYMESLSSYARQFLGIARKPAFDKIDGLCPSIAIDQKTVGKNPRSTVGTTTEIYDYLRVLFARIGRIHCPDCFAPVSAESPERIATLLLSTFKNQYVTIAAPLVIERKGEFVNELMSLFGRGFYRFRIDGQTYRFKSEDDVRALKLKKQNKHTIDLLIDAIDVTSTEKPRLTEAIEKSFLLAHGMCRVIAGEQERLYCSQQMCVQCAISIPELEPRSFSFNSPVGACKGCNGLGFIHEWSWANGDKDSWKERYPEHFSKYAQQKACTCCYGARLNRYALAVTVAEKNIWELGQLSIESLLEFFKTISLEKQEQAIAHELVQEITSRLQFLYNVGLPYLTLNRVVRSLSGGESQRIRLATQIGSALTGILYVLDEPSIGLHQRDNDRLIAMLKYLRDQGNTVVVVEHDMDTIKAADYVIDMGPQAGVRGGNITAIGTPNELAQNKNSLTGQYLSGKKEIIVPKKLRTPKGHVTVEDASKNNLKKITLDIPLGVLACISGVSGSGKSTLIMQELVPLVQQHALKKRRRKISDDATGIDLLEHLVVIDQSPIGRTPRSNPGTYLGIFDEIRKMFASLPESNARGYKVGRFSFNVKNGRCAECNGDGTITISMHFLPDVVVPCRSCKGTRYNARTLDITYRDKNIADILDMTAYEASLFFEHHIRIKKRLDLLCSVGLDYLKIGQPSTTLSGGEAQRIKLVNELAKRGSNTLYILDEPTTGLHSCDIEKLLAVLNRLVDKGNSMLIIEHNLDVLKTADHIIDLGPEGGDGGGMVVAQGSPQEVAKNKKSHTGKYLAKLV